MNIIKCTYKSWDAYDVIGWYSLMGPPSYTWSIIDQNVIMQHTTATWFYQWGNRLNERNQVTCSEPTASMRESWDQNWGVDSIVYAPNIHSTMLPLVLEIKPPAPTHSKVFYKQWCHHSGWWWNAESSSVNKNVQQLGEFGYSTHCVTRGQVPLPLWDIYCCLRNKGCYAIHGALSIRRAVLLNV
jgi:hypothetical protein